MCFLLKQFSNIQRASSQRRSVLTTASRGVHNNNRTQLPNPPSAAMEPERIIPRIFYTQYTHCWSTERLRVQGFTHIVRIDHQNQPPPIDVNANEEALEPGCQLAGLEMVDLDFNNSSPYATMVLPSCYKSVKFIERAMRGSGSILVVGGAKDYGLAIVIVVGYLMYKDHLRFR